MADDDQKKLLGRPRSVDECMARAIRLDQARQQQILRQKKIIDRLLTENQGMQSFIEGLADGDQMMDPVAKAAGHVLLSVEKLREESRD